MRITTSDQLLARLDAGANLKLENGIVKTEGGLAHAMRKIGDFFRSFTEAGRTAIRERSANLRAAMGDLLRSGMDQELAAAVNLPEAGATRSRKAFADSLERIRMARILGAAGNRPQALRTLDLLLRQHMPAGLTRKVLEFCAAPRTEADLRAMREDVRRNIGQEWPVEKAKRVDGTPDSIHTTWPKDMQRKFVSTINGRPPDADYRRQIVDLIPNGTMRGFVTFLTCQAGLMSAIMTGVSTRNADSHSFLGPDIQQLAGARMLLLPEPRLDLRIGNGEAVIAFGVDQALRSCNKGGPCMGGCRHEMEIRIPLNQEVRPGRIPQFEITSLRCTPGLAELQADAEQDRPA